MGRVERRQGRGRAATMRRRWLAGLVFFALVMTPVLEIHAAQPAHSVSGPATAVSFLQTSVRTWATPGASFAIPSVGALIGATFVLIIACVSVIPVDDFGMPTGCAIGSTVLFCATTITVFMFYEGNIWFFKEIVEMNIMMEIQPDDPTLDMMQSRLSSTSMIAFVVSLLYALVNYLCFVPMGEATCMVKRKKLSYFFLPIFILFLTGMMSSRLIWKRNVSRAKPVKSAAVKQKTSISQHKGVTHSKFIKGGGVSSGMDTVLVTPTPTPTPTPTFEETEDDTEDDELGPGWVLMLGQHTLQTYLAHNSLSLLAGMILFFLLLHSIIVCH